MTDVHAGAHERPRRKRCRERLLRERRLREQPRGIMLLCARREQMVVVIVVPHGIRQVRIVIKPHLVARAGVHHEERVLSTQHIRWDGGLLEGIQ